MESINPTIIVAFIMAIPSIILTIAQSRVRKADVSKSITDSYHALAEDLRLEIDRLSTKIDSIEKEREIEQGKVDELETIIANLQIVLEAYVKTEGDLRNGVIVLRKQIIDLNETPIYNLPPELNFDIENKER